MAALPLGSLLSQSWSQFRARLTPILIGVFLFGTIGAVVQIAVQHEVRQGAGVWMEGMGIDPARLEELGRRAQEGDEDALQEMMAGLGGFTQELEGMTEEEQAALVTGQLFDAFAGMLPTMGVGILASFLIGILAVTYFAIVALRQSTDPVVIGRQVPGLLLPVLGLSLWVMIRTFIWVPFIGIIPAVILAPRFLAAFVCLVRDGKGVLESATVSYRVTRGYWGKIWGNWIVLVVLLFVVSIVAGVLAGALSAVSAGASVWFLQLVQQAMAVFALLFSMQLALTIMDNPRMVPAK